MKQETLKQQFQNTYLSGSNIGYIEALYESYLRDPQSVSQEWQTCFTNLPKHNGTQDASLDAVRDAIRQIVLSPETKPSAISGDIAHERKQARVISLINAYRSHGHHHANLDPLQLSERLRIPDLELSFHGLSDSDLGLSFGTGGLLKMPHAQLKEIISVLQKTYCGNIGIEYQHISNNEELAWIEQQFEPIQSTPTFSEQEQCNILRLLTAAEGLEKYLGTKYVGQKRFSIEGADCLIPLLNALVQDAGAKGTKEIVMGMAHRGRLNVLVNILGKSPEDLFQEFEGKFHDTSYSGDVKYHMGFSSNVDTPGGVVHLALAFNPSHLEIINPVVEGSVRSRQERREDTHFNQVLPVLIHGDAAFAGQGVVMETLNFSQARGFRTGGTVHIIINNQIGFTTSNPLDARSTLYCSDVAKMVQAPVFHVNGDDPEAVVFVTKIALAYRMKFNKDVLVDLVCYRRHGHNEADEPQATQPVMYKAIKKHDTQRKIYADYLLDKAVVTKEQANQLNEDYRTALDNGEVVVSLVSEDTLKTHVNWTPYINQNWQADTDTTITPETIQQISKILDIDDPDFIIQTQVKREMESRIKMMAGEQDLNWGCAEMMAYASLLNEGTHVRLCGQDSGRGTFSHRHAVLHDQTTGKMIVPLTTISENQARFTIIDSILSEEAVLGFEYGYTTADPRPLVIWEAQFGDFVNGAQVVIDQFLSSGEQKWGRFCGLVMLLPHGFEGQGPEHSSARLERFLQLCAQDNLQVCIPTTPAQMFHMLRRQVLRPYRKPLIVMTPKSLLRHKLAVSPLDDLLKGHFHCVIPELDHDEIDPKQVKRVVFCSGKVYYDLYAARSENKQKDIAIVRIEQQYPFPEDEVCKTLQTYAHVKDIVWCQEEPKNQGAWYFINPKITDCLRKGQRLSYAGRDHSASPAVGSPYLHQKQQTALVAKALEKP